MAKLSVVDTDKVSPVVETDDWLALEEDVGCEGQLKIR